MLGKYKYYFIKLIISGLLIFWFLHAVNLNEVINSLRSLSLSLFIIVYIVYFISLFISSLKWHILIPQESFFKLYYLNFISYYYSLILPGQVTGEAVKTLRLGRGREDAEKIAVSVVFDKITGIIALACIAVMGLLLTKTEMPFVVILGFLIIIILFIISIFIIRYNIIYNLINRLFLYLDEKLHNHRFMIGRLKNAQEAWLAYANKNKLLFLSVALGATVHIISILVYMKIASEMGISINFVDWCWIFALLSLALFLPISIGGIGVREASLVGILSIFGITTVRAIALSFAIFSLRIGLVIIGFLLEFIVVKRT